MCCNKKMKNRCPCGSDDYIKLFKANKDHSIVKCTNCSLVRVYHVPKYNYTKSEEDVEFYKKHQKLFEVYMKEIVDEVEKFKKKGRLLDIGCSIGLLLNLATKRGWICIGLELSKKAVDYARNILGLNVIEKGLYHSKFKSNSFDAVTLNHAFEHIPNPQSLLKEIRRILKKKGILVISVPNFNSLSAKIFKRYWSHLQPDQHLWFFTPSTLKNLLEQNNFKVKEVIINEPYRDYSGLKGIIKRLFLWPGYFLSEKIGMGRNLIIAAQVEK